MNKYFQLGLIHILIILCFLSTNAQQLNNKLSAGLKLKTMHHLKWVGKEPLLPIFIDHLISSASSEYRWFKYPDNVYIDEDTKSSAFLESHSQDRTILYILEYNTSTHDNLASYEPRRVAYDDEENSKPADSFTDIYTLAYVEGHSIVVTETANDLVAHCNVSILLPSQPSQFQSENLKQIERNLRLDLGFAGDRGHQSRLHNHKPGQKQSKVV